MHSATITRILDVQRGIEGHLLDQSAAIWCALLPVQHASWSFDGLKSGNYLEIGVLHGKSASILAGFSREYENDLHLVDPVFDNQTRARLLGIQPKAEFFPIRSESAFQSSVYRDRLRSVAFAHIDGMHTFAAMTSDLRLCEDLLADFGVLCIDDFHTDLFPQITAAIYRYLYLGNSDLTAFLLGFNKLYLCRNEAKRYYLDWARHRSVDAVAQLGHQLSLAKTDRDDRFDAFALVAWIGARHYGNPDR